MRKFLVILAIVASFAAVASFVDLLSVDEPTVAVNWNSSPNKKI